MPAKSSKRRGGKRSPKKQSRSRSPKRSPKKSTTPRRKPSPRKTPNWGKYDSKRPSPGPSATTYPVGYITTGKDGYTLYKIVKGKQSKIKKWVKCGAKGC